MLGEINDFRGGAIDAAFDQPARQAGYPLRA
jgi:hypothetical protein